jgi:hypothetical protein
VSRLEVLDLGASDQIDETRFVVLVDDATALARG